MTIDTHVHVWDQNQISYPWMKDAPGFDTSFLPGDLDVVPDSRYVFVQVDAAPEHGAAEARWVAGLGDGDLAGIVAFAPLETAEARPALEELRGVESVVGIRRLLQDEDVSFFEHPGFAAGLEELASVGWTFDACVRWWQLPALAELIARHPDVPFVLDHVGKPPLGGSEAGDAEAHNVWRAGLAAVAELPHAFVKLSGLPAEADTGVGADVYTPWLREARDLFGPKRCMLGSDWPISAGTGLTRGQWFDAVRHALELSPTEWADVSEHTAERVYSLMSRA